MFCRRFLSLDPDSDQERGSDEHEWYASNIILGTYGSVPIELCSAALYAYNGFCNFDLVVAKHIEEMTNFRTSLIF